ncbi:hypothetical protein [Candidatus Parabeggiatoa sp. HSG14]|uniref:hypothetical protein n=1 Tax=Candidatus Parabeggiatoa sp. HSG14 TaxID=3055593 RepID=UPI0025A6CBE5|nr:hypothetical protein [Thiotrichales bacterium HSG14]
MTEQEQPKTQQGDEKLVDPVKKEPNVPGEKKTTAPIGPQTSAEPVKKEPDVPGEKKSTVPISSQTSVRPKVESDLIDTLLTTGNISNSTINIKGSKETLEDNPPFKDPTRSFPSKPPGLPAFNYPQEIKKRLVDLKKNRILLIDCFDDNILRAASYELVQRMEASYEQRLLTFEGSQLEQTDFHLGVFVNEKIGNGEKLIVVISLKSQNFLDSMFFEEPFHAQSIKEQLEQNDIMLICFANTDFLQKTLEEKRSYFHFSKWHIDFLPYLLKVYFTEDTEALQTQILQQRNYGLWGENNSNSEFYDLISGYLRNGTEQLQEEIKKNEKYSPGQSVKEFKEKTRSVKAKELVQNDDLVKNTVFYVATFFPGLSRHEFYSIVSLLLQDEKTKTAIESQIKDKKGRIKIVHTQEEKDCLEIWKKDQDNIMETCYLQVIRSEIGSQIVDFSFPYLRGELRKHLEQKNIYNKHFEKIRESGLLFDFNMSSTFIEHLIKLAAEMAVSDPSYYGGNWLMGIIFGLKQHSDIQVKIDYLNVNLRNLTPELIASELEKIEQQVRPIIIRLSELIRKMLNYPQLQEVIKNFLENLMREENYGAVLVIVLGIVKQLRFTSQFDGMYWIKQLLERGNPKAKKEAYRTLLQQAKQSGFRIYELLDAVKKWLPNRDLDSKKYSSSNKYALKFVISYAWEMRSNFKVVDYGLWPSKYPLFANLKEDNNLTQIDQLISWVFHPGVEYIFKHEMIDVVVKFAELIEMWFKILHGFDTKNTHPEVLPISERLLQQVVLNTNRSQQISFMRHWQLRQNFFTHEIIKISITERAKRQQLINERKIILELHKKFKELSKEKRFDYSKRYS